MDGNPLIFVKPITAGNHFPPEMFSSGFLIKDEDEVATTYFSAITNTQRREAIVVIVGVSVHP